MTDLLMPPSLLFVESFIYAFNTSAFLSGKMLVFVLLVCSIAGWTIMLLKFQELKRLRAECDRFLHLFRRSEHPLALANRLSQIPHSPLMRIYEQACIALSQEVESRTGLESLAQMEPDRIRLNTVQLGAVRNAAEREIADQLVELEKTMEWLAIVVSISPMIGLLGTVWGVMDSFVEMAKLGMVNLEAVAPGIAGALLTTVIGLIIAIPSVGAYNLLANKIRVMTVQMDNFADQFMAEAQRLYHRD